MSGEHFGLVMNTPVSCVHHAYSFTRLSFLVAREGRPDVHETIFDLISTFFPSRHHPLLLLFCEKLLPSLAAIVRLWYLPKRDKLGIGIEIGTNPTEMTVATPAVLLDAGHIAFYS